MAFAMSVNETAPLAFERSLNVGGARRYTRLQSCCDFVVMWFTWCRQAQTTDAKSLDPDYVTVVQFCHEQKELSLRARIFRHYLMHSLQGRHWRLGLGNVRQNRLRSTVRSIKLSWTNASIDVEMAAIRWSLV